jgi:hypothetical protein
MPKPKIKLNLDPPLPPKGLLAQPSIADEYAIPMPYGSVEGGGFQMPRVNLGLTLPTYGGELGLEGAYQQQPNLPADWAAKLGYKRRF